MTRDELISKAFAADDGKLHDLVPDLIRILECWGLLKVDAPPDPVQRLADELGVSRERVFRALSNGGIYLNKSGLS